MHMSDALISPAVGAGFMAVSFTALGYCVKKISVHENDENKIPMMGVMGAFVFAAQMINFAIPGTGSSAHIGGGVLLAALLGPYHALLSISCVLLIQCLFFADGGLLAYGCNVFNLGVCTCLIAYCLIFKPIIQKNINKKTLAISSVLTVTAGLLLGAFFVCLETFASGVTELPLGTFLMLMLPVHLAAGLIEGIVTAAVLWYVYSTRPELLIHNGNVKKQKFGVGKILAVFLTLTVITGGVLSLIASDKPDGLEWSIERITGSTDLERNGTVYNSLGTVIESTAIMPDYSFKENEGLPLSQSAAGIIGSAITITVSCVVGLIIYLVKRRLGKN